MTEAAPSSHRLTPAFRVGVTGTRRIDPAALPGLQMQLTAVLSHIRSQVEDLVRATPVPGLYADSPALLRFLSPLAEGADRLAAAAALAEGYQLEAPLPFAAADYETDFPDSVETFRALLAQAGPRVLELDGARGDDETASYEAAGRYVIRNCDLLIAIWDGGKGNGRGGTAEIVHYALRHGMPVWWLHAGGAADPAWLERHPQNSPPERSGALLRLDEYLRHTIIPPATQASKDPLCRFLSETQPPDRFIWSIYHRVMRLAAGPARPLSPPPMPPQPTSPAWSFWQEQYEPVDRLAVAYGNRYRSSYILVFGLAAWVLSFAVIGVGFGPEALVSTLFELAGLAAIFVIVKVNLEKNWHERLISYRLLAELCRKQQALSMFGWRLELHSAWPAAGTADGTTEPSGDSWAAWYFDALVRAAPPPQGQMGGDTLRHHFQAIEASLVGGQAEYHARRRQESEAASQRLGNLGRGFFFATVVMVLIKFGLLLSQYFQPPTSADDLDTIGTTILRFLLGLTPGVSAAFAGIRGYAELGLLADQSAQMERLMRRAEVNLQRLDLSVPLASQTAGAALLNLTEAMMRDIKGWTQLFRIKSVEPG